MRTDSYINEQLDWTKATLYKYGPQHHLDLVERDVVEELKFDRSLRNYREFMEQEAGPSSLKEEHEGNENGNHSNCYL